MLKIMSQDKGVSYGKSPIYNDFRPGYVRHSLASIDKITQELRYVSSISISNGLLKALPWYLKRFAWTRCTVFSQAFKLKIKVKARLQNPGFLNWSSFFW